MRTDIGIYCHLPFCRKKCAYCDFYSGDFYGMADRYVSAVLKEAALYHDRYPELTVSTLYFGGGTPSSLSHDQLSALITGLFKLFSLDPEAEITLEANPATVDEEKLALLKKLGVNRLSLGVQSTENRELAVLSRLHSFEDFSETYDLARRYFDNISLDLMYGLPYQTEASFQKSLTRIMALSPTHISLYALKIEEGTPFYHMRNELSLPDDDSVADMYLSACRELQKNGYQQYEISNFAKQGRQSRHNLRYWQGKAYLGLGAYAHSYFGGVRYANQADIHAYCHALLSGESSPLSERNILSQKDLLEEAILLPLRLTAGLDVSYLKKAFGYDMMEKTEKTISFCVKEGFMTFDGCHLAFTPKGFLVSNTILSELLP